jgi:hypothetical protein
MASHALWFEKCPNKFHENDERYIWVQSSLNTTFPWSIIVRHYHMSAASTLLTTKKRTLLSKPTASGGITFSGRKQ